jgi:hypothetical protein
MSRYSRNHNDGYHSDDSTLIPDERTSSSRYRSPSTASSRFRRRSYFSRSPHSPNEYRSSEHDHEGLSGNKTPLVLGLLAVAAGIFHVWHNKRSEEREEEERKRRRRDFARRKAERREREARTERGRGEEEVVGGREEVRRIGYGKARSRSRAPRMIEEAPGGEAYDEAERRARRERRS